MRPLTLHASALTASEYDFYTESFLDIVDEPGANAHGDAFFATTTVGVREARAWLRGRYPELAPTDLDTVSVACLQATCA
jgi:hypothetical protein